MYKKEAHKENFRVVSIGIENAIRAFVHEGTDICYGRNPIRVYSLFALYFLYGAHLSVISSSVEYESPMENKGLHASGGGNHTL